jgi:hypothetical protein
MPKKKPAKREDYQQIARRVLDTIAPDAEPAKRKSQPARKTAPRKRMAR